MERRLRISNHHGDLERPNNLKAARNIIERFGDEIDIYEIDFVSYGKKIISSHDYKMSKIEDGSRLEKWIRMVVVENRKILWIDVKENLDIFMACGFGKFNVDALFETLDRVRQHVRTKRNFDIVPYIWIGCQDLGLRAQLREWRGEWTIIMDMPSVTNYIYQYIPLIPKTVLRDWICDECLASDYKAYPIVTLDESFFLSTKEMKKFIQKLHISPDVPIVLNSFDRSQPPLEIPNQYIIMQYNYSLS